MDLPAGMDQDDSMFGIDNVGLDFNDFEILNGKTCDDYWPPFDRRINSPDILPETPSDSSSEQCLSSPTYMMNSPSDHSAVLQYPDNPALYQGRPHSVSPIYQLSMTMTGPQTAVEDLPCHAGGGGGYVKSSVPDLSGVDYEQPLEMLRSAQAGQALAGFYPDIEGKQYSGLLQGEEVVAGPVRNQGVQGVVGINNNGLAHLEYRDISGSPALPATNMIKQEPVASPTNTAGASKPAVNHRKKRRRDPSAPAGEENSSEASSGSTGSSVKIKSENDGGDQTQSVHFSPFQATKWRETFTSNLENLKTPVVKVIADKGFNFSQVDDAFIAQKKNHFQLSCHISKEGEHELVGTETGGYNKIQYLQLNFYGVKKEAPEQKIQVIKTGDAFRSLKLHVCFSLF